jgi:hypothetical protein
MNQRYTMVSGTVRWYQGNNQVDIPTIVRLDTQTGQAWLLEFVQQIGFSWVNIIERGAPPQH